MRLTLIALAWVTGIFISGQFLVLSPSFWLFGLMLAGLGWLFVRKSVSRPILTFLIIACLGALRFRLVPQTSHIATFNGLIGVTIEGFVEDEPDVRDDRIQLRVAVETVTQLGEPEQTRGAVLVQALPLTSVQYGDRIRATGIMVTPEEFDTFSYSDFLARTGVFSVMRQAVVDVITSNHGNPFYQAIFQIKQRAQETISTALPEPQAGILSGILLGNERGIAPELRDGFNAVGASHIIAISGFNMVIISTIVIRLFQRLTTRRWLPVILASIIIGIYTLFVGANLAVVRASLMSLLLVVAPLLRRKTYVPASLAFIVLLFSVLNPLDLWDVSFQLSFAAVLGLALFVDPLSRWFNLLIHHLFPARWARTLGDWLNEPLIVTLAAQITTLPLTVLYFNRLSLISPIVNLLIVPVQAILLIVGGVATMVGLIVPSVAILLYWVTLVFLSWSIAIVRLFARFDSADIPVSIDSRLISLFFILLIVGAIMHATRPPRFVRIWNWIKQRQILSAMLASGIILVIIMIGMFRSRPDGYLHVWMLDVGHSNAFLIQTPQGAQILVDGGRFPSRLLTSIGDRIPFYDREIEVLAITHPDEFDISALVAVLERYDVGIALSNGQINLGEAVNQIDEQLSHTESLVLQAGFTLEMDNGVAVEVLNPQIEADLTEPLNDHVIVLRLSYGAFSMLLTSDLSVEGQQAILEAGNFPVSTVLQIPQHGTQRALDWDFLQAVQPQVAFIQSDVSNRRGDPDGDVLALLADIPIFRTDEGGAIHLWTDGESIWIEESRID